MKTRQDYLEGRCEHSEYYGEIAKVCGVAFTDSADIARFKRALATDSNLNSIPLAWWDGRAAALMTYNGAAVRRALKERGDFYSMAGGVCILKEAARKAAGGLS